MCKSDHEVSDELLSEEPRIANHWAAYFEQLHEANPPAHELISGKVAPVVVDPTASKGNFETAAGAKVGDICGIQSELLKVGGEATPLALRMVISSV